MGIQINGTNDTISATDGGLNIEGSDIRLPSGSSIGVNGAVAQTPLDVISNTSGNGITVRGRSADGLGNIRFTSNNYGTLYGGLIHNATNLNLFNERAGSLILGSNGIDRVTIDSSGRVTMPYQPCFSVYRTTDQNIAHNTLTKVQFNTENFDVGSNYDSSTNFRFTAPVAGKYAFMGVIYIYSVYQAEVSIYKNGAQFKRYSGALGSGGNDNPNGRTYAGVVDLAVNDYVEIYAYMTRNGDSATQSIYGGSLRETSFDGYLIG